MVQYDEARRGVLEQLGRADASVTDLADKFHMTLTGMKKHVGVLERAGLVTLKRLGASEPAGLACERWKKKQAGSSGTANCGAHASTSWTRLSKN